MRQQICFKIAKLAVTEILLQVGFEKSSEDALNTLTDVFCYYILRKFAKAKRMQQMRFGIYKIPLSFFIYTKSLELYSYRHEEIRAFLSYQAFLSSYLKDAFKVEGDSMLQMLRVLPQRKMKLEAFNRKYRANLSEIKSDFTESRDVEIDDFMFSFLEKAVKEEREESQGHTEYAKLTDDLVKVGGSAALKIDEGVYENFLSAKRKSFYEHFKEDVTFADRVTEDFTFFGKKIIDRHIFDNA